MDASAPRRSGNVWVVMFQVPEVTVTPESGVPRDAGGAVDYDALARLLKDTQNLQDQADILYILFMDK